MFLCGTVEVRKNKCGIKNVSRNASLKAVGISCAGPRRARRMHEAGWASSDLCRVEPTTSGSDTSVTYSRQQLQQSVWYKHASFRSGSFSVSLSVKQLHWPPCPFCVITRDVDNDLTHKITQSVSKNVVKLAYCCALATVVCQHANPWSSGNFYSEQAGWIRVAHKFIH